MSATTREHACRVLNAELYRLLHEVGGLHWTPEQESEAGGSLPHLVSLLTKRGGVPLRMGDPEERRLGQLLEWRAAQHPRTWQGKPLVRWLEARPEEMGEEGGGAAGGLRPGQTTEDGGKHEPPEEPDLGEFIANQFRGDYGPTSPGIKKSTGYLLHNGHGVPMGPEDDGRYEDHRAALPSTDAMRRWGWPKGVADRHEAGERGQALGELIRRARAVRVHHDDDQLVLDYSHDLTDQQKRAIAHAVRAGRPATVIVTRDGEHEIQLENPSPGHVARAIQQADEAARGAPPEEMGEHDGIDEPIHTGSGVDRIGRRYAVAAGRHVPVPPGAAEAPPSPGPSKFAAGPAPEPTQPAPQAPIVTTGRPARSPAAPRPGAAQPTVFVPRPRPSAQAPMPRATNTPQQRAAARLAAPQKPPAPSQTPAPAPQAQAQPAPPPRARNRGPTPAARQIPTAKLRGTVPLAGDAIDDAVLEGDQGEQDALPVAPRGRQYRGPTPPQVPGLEAVPELEEVPEPTRWDRLKGAGRRVASAAQGAGRRVADAALGADAKARAAGRAVGSAARKVTDVGAAARGAKDLAKRGAAAVGRGAVNALNNAPSPGQVGRKAADLGRKAVDALGRVPNPADVIDDGLERGANPPARQAGPAQARPRQGRPAPPGSVAKDAAVLRGLTRNGPLSARQAARVNAQLAGASPAYLRHLHRELGGGAGPGADAGKLRRAIVLRLSGRPPEEFDEGGGGQPEDAVSVLTRKPRGLFATRKMAEPGERNFAKAQTANQAGNYRRQADNEAAARRAQTPQEADPVDEQPTAPEPPTQTPPQTGRPAVPPATAPGPDLYPLIASARLHSRADRAMLSDEFEAAGHQRLADALRQRVAPVGAAQQFLDEIDSWPADAYEATAEKGLAPPDAKLLRELCEESGDDYHEAEADVILYALERAATARAREQQGD